ncbi:hypothetical protein J437_LFUL001821, partial [Ladona fulva]
NRKTYFFFTAPPSCGSPNKKENTTFSGSDFSVGASIIYDCPVGHLLQGSSIRECGTTGFWSGTPPTCKYVDCGPLKAPANGNLRFDENRTSYGAVAMYSCDKNYTISGHANRTCGDDGKWSGEEPECLFDWCPAPPEVSGAKVETTGRKAGSIATYSCMPGFILTGHSVLSCGYGGEWSGKIPTCKYVDCGSPPQIQNGRFRLLNGTTTAESMVEYDCDEDYWLSREDNIQICTRDGKWSGSTPSCECEFYSCSIFVLVITCETPEDPSGGYVATESNKVHSTIEYHCDPGHILHGDQTSVCGRDGEWSGDIPECEYVDCGKLPPLLNGAITYVDGSTHLGSEITYSCVRNYRLAPTNNNGARGEEVNPKRYCQENRQWSGISPRCEEIRCSEPAVPAHAILSVTGNDRAYGRTLIRTAENAKTPSTQTYRIGAIVKFRCERGYKIVGDALGTCEDTGLWSVQVPQCVYVDCGSPEHIENGNFTLASNATYYGAVALYECVENYQVDGHARRLCLENGTWSSDPPVCKGLLFHQIDEDLLEPNLVVTEITCAEPDTDSTMTAKVSSHSVNGVATYSCNLGGILEGNATRICMKKGIWSGKMPSCTLIDCQHPGLIEDGRVIVMNGTTTYGSLVEYHCVPKYERIGTYLRRCMENGQWSGEAPQCQLAVSAPAEEEPQTLALTIGICAGVVFLLIIILGLIYIRLRKATPVKNTENIEGAERKEDRNAAVMSYATLSDGSNGANIYENIIENDELGSNGPTYDRTYERTYDSPYDDGTLGRQGNGNTNSFYETVPKANGNAMVTINGVAVR